jgi:hypothetical protein
VSDAATIEALRQRIERLDNDARTAREHASFLRERLKEMTRPATQQAFRCYQTVRNADGSVAEEIVDVRYSRGAAVRWSRMSARGLVRNSRYDPKRIKPGQTIEHRIEPPKENAP